MVALPILATFKMQEIEPKPHLSVLNKTEFLHLLAQKFPNFGGGGDHCPQCVNQFVMCQTKYQTLSLIK